MEMEMSVETAQKIVLSLPVNLQNPSENELYAAAESFLKSHFATLEAEAKAKAEEIKRKAERDAKSPVQTIEEAIADANAAGDHEDAAQLSKRLIECKRWARRAKVGLDPFLFQR